MSRKIPTIADLFKRFADYSLKEAPPEQVRVIKITYYKAVHDFLAVQKDVVGAPDVSEEAGVESLKGWLDECETLLSNDPNCRRQT